MSIEALKKFVDITIAKDGPSATIKLETLRKILNS